MEINWTLARKRRALEARAAIIQEIRRFFILGGYLEVDTPLRIPAPAPEAHIDGIPSPPWYLQTSPELCMKRLLAAGYERLFQVCHCWRAGERGSRHHPEFTLLEWYRAGADYRDLMTECEELIRGIASLLGRGCRITYRGREINLAGEWERLSVRDAFSRYGGISMEGACTAGRFDEVMAEAIEPHLGTATPTFLCDYPVERGALARVSPIDPRVVERFELYVGGLELANAFSELTDPAEQRHRFLEENERRRSNGLAPYPLPEKFLQELSQLPPAAGIALGVDRLAMLFLDETSIDGVVAFAPEEL